MNVSRISTLRYYLGTGFLLVLIFTALKPEGTRGADLFSRLIVWSLQVGTLLPMLIGLHIWLQSASSFNHLNPWIKLLFSGILGSLLFAPLGLVIDHLFGLEAEYAVTSPWRLTALFMDESLSILFPVTLTWVAINVPRVLRLNFAEMETSQTEGNKMQVCASGPRYSKGILRLLPAAVGKDVIYLKSELHYLRVVTAKGDTLILYNLRDAIIELEQLRSGIQTHRSYWVSGCHIDRLISENGSKFLLAGGGHKIPVSRRKVQSVREYMNALSRSPIPLSFN